MFRIKKLYSFMFWTFLQLLLATFSVCLFILLMQWLWKYVDDLVGKGVEISVLAELFFYSANQLVPQALPIAVLLASLMTFGNLGEHLELLAMKSSGISLIRIMKPLIILTFFLSCISFVFHNNVLPGAQAKLFTILYSIRMKTPELDIPEKSFYKGIEKYNIYVGKKDKTGLLMDVMIYEYSKGFDNMKVIVADSGRMNISDDKTCLIFTLYNGESFQNFNINKSRFDQNQIPFQRQKFNIQDILINFNSNLVMADESFFSNREFSKNIPELRSFIRERSISDDSITNDIRSNIAENVYTSSFKQARSSRTTSNLQNDTIPYSNYELLYKSFSEDKKLQLLNEAKTKVDRLVNDYSYKLYEQTDSQRPIRGHKIELHRKFTWSLACFLFFFIGAPLGAIIRKGGLGLPAVLSVFLFILYYYVDIFGMKMVRQDNWPTWEGMWLSSFVLASLGLFFTYKAVNDSVVFNIDAWKETLLRFTGKREIRNYSKKTVIMNFPDYKEDIRIMEKWNEEANLYIGKKRKIPFYISFWKQNFNDMHLTNLLSVMDNWIDDLLNSNENLIIGKLMDYPVINSFNLTFFNQPAIRWSCSVIFPVGILIYIVCVLKQKQINNDLHISIKVNEEIIKELTNLKLA